MTPQIKKNIIISLADKSEIIFLMRLFQSIKMQNKNTHWTLVTWPENLDVVQLFEGFDQVVTVNKSKYSKIQSTPLFPNSFGLNALWEDLGDIFREKYTKLINISNNEISAVIASCITTESVTGIKFNEYANVELSDPWTAFTNEIFTEQAESFNRFDLLKFACSITENYQPILKNSKVPSTILNQSFASIRQKAKTTATGGAGSTGAGATVTATDRKIIGIDLAGLPKDETDWSEIIFTLSASEQYYPVILVQKNNSDHREILQKVLRTLEYKLTTLEYSLTSATKMIEELDGVISGSGVIKQLVHLANVPCLTLKENIISNLGYSDRISDLVFITSLANPETNGIIAALDILIAGKVSKSTSMPNDDLFQVVKDSWGSFLLQLTGEMKENANIRNYLSRLFYIEQNTSSSLHLKDCWILELLEANELENIINDERKKLEETNKSLLNLLRALNDMRSGVDVQNQSKKFFVGIDHLLNNSATSASNEAANSESIDLANVGLANVIRFLERPRLLSIQETGEDGLKAIQNELLNFKHAVNEATNFCHKLHAFYSRANLVKETRTISNVDSL